LNFAKTQTRMPARTAPTTSVLESLPTLIPRAFDQAQTSTANHQKNFATLHKLYTDAAKHTESVNNGAGIKLIGERAFEDLFVDMVSRVLSVKKGASQADRIVRFVGGFTKFINEKSVCHFAQYIFSMLISTLAAEQRKNQPRDDEDDDEDTPTSRFTARVLRFLLKGFPAKDKTVRYRVVHLVTEMVACLGEIEYVSVTRSAQ
jgi:condensin complex subunit 3